MNQEVEVKYSESKDVFYIFERDENATDWRIRSIVGNEPFYSKLVEYYTKDIVDMYRSERKTDVLWKSKLGTYMFNRPEEIEMVIYKSPLGVPTKQFDTKVGLPTPFMVRFKDDDRYRREYEDLDGRLHYSKPHLHLEAG